MEQTPEVEKKLPSGVVSGDNKTRWSNGTSAERLVDYCLLGMLPNDYEITLDYFGGIARCSDDGRLAYLRRVQLVFAIYSELIRTFSVDADTLHSAMIEGRLMTLIADNYNQHPCKLYDDFCTEDIDLDVRAWQEN